MSIGTEDFSYGVISAQKMLATVPAGTDNVTVGIPPNAETLVVTYPEPAVNYYPRCHGTTTGYPYPGVSTPAGGIASPYQTWFFDVSSALDSEVNIVFSQAPGIKWYVYADAQAHVLLDGTGAYDSIGVQYQAPVPPSGTGIGPSFNELKLASGNFTASGAIIPAPGGGLRLRIFALQIQGNNAGSLMSVNNGNGGLGLAVCLGTNSVNLPIPLSGYALTANTPLWANVPAYGAYVSAYYTLEYT